MNRKTYMPDQESVTERLDIFISGSAGLSRSHTQKLVKEGMVLVNSNTEKPGYRLKKGDVIELTIPEEPQVTLVPEDIPLEVPFEDSHIIVVNKPPGIVIYPAAGHRNGTLMNALIARCGNLASIGSPLRPGVVHRLDKDTSGLIVFAKNDKAYLDLFRQFREREVEKVYQALVYGNPKRDSGEIRYAIGRSLSDRKKMSTRTRKGKEAVTRFKVINRFKTSSLIQVQIVTGRTHQIRVHFMASGHPVLGDKTYGKKTVIKLKQKLISFKRQMLHAYSLKLTHPATGKPVELTAPIPEDMQKAIEELSDSDG
jgi:23S rRNA pseudouridine1911/1915/1917 synthase